MKDLTQFEKEVAQLVLNRFTEKEIKMAGLSLDKVIDDLSDRKNGHGEVVPKYKSLPTTIQQQYEEDNTVEGTYNVLFPAYLQLVQGQLSAM